MLAVVVGVAATSVLLDFAPNIPPPPPPPKSPPAAPPAAGGAPAGVVDESGNMGLAGVAAAAPMPGTARLLPNVGADDVGVAVAPPPNTPEAAGAVVVVAAWPWLDDTAWPNKPPPAAVVGVEATLPKMFTAGFSAALLALPNSPPDAGAAEAAPPPPNKLDAPVADFAPKIPLAGAGVVEAPPKTPDGVAGLVDAGAPKTLLGLGALPVLLVPNPNVGAVAPPLPPAEPNIPPDAGAEDVVLLFAAPLDAGVPNANGEAMVATSLDGVEVKLGYSRNASGIGRVLPRDVEVS